MAEYETWQADHGDTAILSRSDRVILNELNKRAHDYRLHRRGWHPIGGGLWQLIADSEIRGEATSNKPGDGKPLLVRELSPGDTSFKVSVTVETTSAQSSGGLAFAVTGDVVSGDVDRFYAYGFSSESQQEVVIRTNRLTDRSDTIWSRPRTVPHGEPFRMRVQAEGNRVSFYFNDKLSTVLSLDEFPRGRLGLVIWGQDPTRFRNASFETMGE